MISLVYVSAFEVIYFLRTPFHFTNKLICLKFRPLFTSDIAQEIMTAVKVLLSCYYPRPCAQSHSFFSVFARAWMTTFITDICPSVHHNTRGDSSVWFSIIFITIKITPVSL